MSAAKIIEISSDSDNSFEHAIRKGLTRAVEAIQNIEEAWLESQQLLISDGRVTGFRVTMKLGVGE